MRKTLCCIDEIMLYADRAECAHSVSGITVVLTGRDGNASAIIGRVRRALSRGGRPDLVESFTNEAKSGDYHHLLETCHKYCEVV